MTEETTRSEPEDSRGVGWVVTQGFIFAFFLIAVMFGEPVNDVPGLVVIQIFGLATALMGAAVSVWAFFGHGWNVSPFPKPVEGAVLVDSGAYRYVRHPMYSGIILFTLGVGLAYVNPIVLMSSLTFLVFFMAKTGREEEMLVDTVEGYRAYRSAVPWRLIPHLV